MENLFIELIKLLVDEVAKEDENGNDKQKQI